ncbi:hypothetical protein M3223_08890 [Paenibacillus pasadenensis]|uniref:hypothetical protein n=1 Tax=Paenibacillus pasadenensis TaxID=217090 RepID=UPI00203FF82C|nr:hypothetical protein [Paenibacillus pasadenensis]MCM3747470.1 hypothetical protein [Paenibacillus pasadenensis]
MSDTQMNTLIIQVAKLETSQEASTKALSEVAFSVGRLVDRLESSDDVAKEAAQSARSAHKRIDKLEDAVKEDKDDMDDAIERMRQGQRYVVTTACALISIGVAAIGLAIKFVQ